MRQVLFYLGYRRRIDAECRNPGKNSYGDLGVLGEEVRCADVSMDVRVRHASFQIMEVSVREDRVRWSPQEERRYLSEVSEAGSHFVEPWCARMMPFQGYVLHE
jgi:hypothetical protein